MFERSEFVRFWLSLVPVFNMRVSLSFLFSFSLPRNKEKENECGVKGGA